MPNALSYPVVGRELFGAFEVIFPVDSLFT